MTILDIISKHVNRNYKSGVAIILFIFLMVLLGGCNSQSQKQIAEQSDLKPDTKIFEGEVMEQPETKIEYPNNPEAIIKLEADDPLWPTRPKGNDFRIWMYRDDSDSPRYCNAVVEPGDKPTCRTDIVTVAWQTGDALPNCHHNGMWIFLDKERSYTRSYSGSAYFPKDSDIAGSGDLIPDNRPCFDSITDGRIFLPFDRVHGVLQVAQPFVAKDPLKLTEVRWVFSDEIEIDGASLKDVICFGTKPCPTDVTFSDVAKAKSSQGKAVDKVEILKTLFSDQNDFGDYEYDDPHWPPRPEGKLFRIWVYPTAYGGLDSAQSTTMRIRWQTGKELPHCRSGVWTSFSYSVDYKNTPWIRIRPGSHVGYSSIGDDQWSKSDPVPDNLPCTSELSWEEEPPARIISYEDGSLLGSYNAVIQILQPLLVNKKLDWALSDKVRVEGRTLREIHCFGPTPCPTNIPFDDVEETP